MAVDCLLRKNIFHVTGPLCEESTSHWWIPLTKTSDTELWCFLWYVLEQTAERTVRRQVNLDVLVLIWRHCNGHWKLFGIHQTEGGFRLDFAYQSWLYAGDLPVYFFMCKCLRISKFCGVCGRGQGITMVLVSYPKIFCSQEQKGYC